MNPWIRLYRESLHDPKIVTLSDRLHRAWHNCLLIADDTGLLPPLRDVAAHMRMPTTDVEQILIDLLDANLVDADVLSGSRVYRMHGWAKRQYVSDISTVRSQKHRAKKRATGMQRCSNGSETPPDTDTDTDTELVTPLPPEPDPKGREQVLNSNFERGSEADREGGSSSRKPFALATVKECSAATGVRELTLKRAAGMNLDVDALLEITRRGARTNPDGYFQALCRTELQRLLPGLNEDVLRATFARNTDAYGRVLQMLTLVPA